VQIRLRLLGGNTKKKRKAKGKSPIKSPSKLKAVRARVSTANLQLTAQLSPSTLSLLQLESTKAMLQVKSLS